MFDKVIINADDFGLAPGVNRGIIECHEAGTLTSTTLLVNGLAAAGAAELASSRSGLGVGLHLNLTRGTPVLPAREVPWLVRDGLFLGRAGLLYRLSTGLAPTSELEAEIGAQIDRCRQLGIEPTHIDSHHHVHAHPRLRHLMERVCARKGIHKARTYRPVLVAGNPPGEGFDQSINRRAGAVVLGLAELATRGKRLDGPDRIYGIEGLEAGLNRLLQQKPAGERERRSRTDRALFDNRVVRGLSTNRLARALSQSAPAQAFSDVRVPGPGPSAGTLEIMCHPGHVDATLKSVSSYVSGREAELGLLLSPKVKEMLGDSGTRLVSYRDL